MRLDHARLAAFLATQPADVRSVTLSFAEAGELLGTSLPIAARNPLWWVRRPANARHPGWRIGRPHLTPDGWAVTFRRSDTIEEPVARGRP